MTDFAKFFERSDADAILCSGTDLAAQSFDPKTDRAMNYCAMEGVRSIARIASLLQQNGPPYRAVVLCMPAGRRAYTLARVVVRLKEELATSPAAQGGEITT